MGEAFFYRSDIVLFLPHKALLFILSLELFHDSVLNSGSRTCQSPKKVL